ncbi:hypothetical protein KKG45_08815 [bacterium]|nr:hypothetical protein [bacterium]MBU1676450.1 hypothetical protein [bacterium]
MVGLASHSEPNPVLSGLQARTEIALEEIKAKHHELLDSLDAQKRDLLQVVNVLSKANAVITARLNSIRNVQHARMTSRRPWA